jgi:hypothetical protein
VSAFRPTYRHPATYVVSAFRRTYHHPAAHRG